MFDDILKLEKKTHTRTIGAIVLIFYEFKISKVLNEEKNRLNKLSKK